MKCKHKLCRKSAAKGRKECARCKMKAWRERNPTAAAWNTHKTHAKERGVKVEWSREEFFAFCEMTSYHFLRSEGWTIERMDCDQGYSLANCEIAPRKYNDAKGAFVDRWLKHKTK